MITHAKQKLGTLFTLDNTFFKMAKRGGRIPPLAIAIPVFMLVIFVGAGFSEFVIFELLLKNKLSPFFKKYYYFTVSFSCITLLLWLWIRYYEKRPFLSIGLSKPNALKNYVNGFLTGFIMMLLTVGLMAVNGNVIMDQQSTIPSGITAVGSVFFFMIAYIIQGANEEIVTRGWLFQVIGTRYKPWIGALVSSLLFALMHGANKGASIIAILNLFLFSFLLVIFILKDHNIWAACGWHTSWNWTMGNVLGLSVSGREGVITLVNLQTTGSKTFSGGEFGPEGSIMATVVLFSGIFIVFFSRVKKRVIVNNENQNAGLITSTPTKNDFL